MAEWRSEFQYLLDRKILSAEELAYLFGQIKSIIDTALATSEAECERLKKIVDNLATGIEIRAGIKKEKDNEEISEKSS